MLDLTLSKSLVTNIKECLSATSKKLFRPRQLQLSVLRLNIPTELLTMYLKSLRFANHTEFLFTLTQLSEDMFFHS